MKSLETLLSDRVMMTIWRIPKTDLIIINIIKPDIARIFIQDMQF